MFVIGTAGHVDHGKSTLIEVLTGINPDRLKEEILREMTIDLGFAWMELPGGVEVGIVDVPGHRDFIENMLAGVGGIDAVLFVIAADEGVMPQTREHLLILDILQIQRGVIALTKIDLIEDPEWLTLVESEIRDAVEHTCLASAPIVPVSAKTGEGLLELRQSLSECLQETPPKADLGRPRLPVDRVFSLTGFGTIVTGTLQDGSLKVGDEIEVLPRGLRGRIRGLQTHKRKEETAKPGRRTAVNISGINTEQIQRGDVISLPGLYSPTQRVDALLRVASGIESALQHNMEIKFFHATSEVIGRLRLLGSDELKAGEEGWVQIEFRQPVVVAKGDRYILRRPSPPETLGGGLILEAHSPRRYKRFAPEVLERLKGLSTGDPLGVMVQIIQQAGFLTEKEVFQAARLDAQLAQEVLQGLLESNRVVVVGEESSRSGLNRWLTTRKIFNREQERLVDLVRDFHQQSPLKRGIPREALKNRAGLPPKVFQSLYQGLLNEQRLVEENLIVRLPQHTIRFSPPQERLVHQLMVQFSASPYNPPTVRDCCALVGDEIFQALVDRGDLIQVSAEVVFRADTYQEMLAEVKAMIRQHGSITVAQFRDRFSTSRKYALPFLEHLDQRRITVRDGDSRKLFPTK
ncbi:selenocysteine-specific translation elongation factor SelB [Bellilinea caldifistulae]|nr:selenocysteine-specific translation elongation factor [Bellilinea caldifistulae]GAP11422.1 selenocysteine-specific translation elongation factor SelB [Bellilinea caldifistulae]